jgi:glycerophosphoryl diester phosphodiesterase
MRRAALARRSWHEEWPDTADHLLRDEPYLAGVAPDRDHRGGVLTLDALLGLVRDASRPVRLFVETKHPTRYSGLVEKELVRQLARYGWAGQPGPASSLRHPVEPTDGRVTVMSFAQTALRRVRLLAPEVPTVLLLERLLPGRRDGVLPASVGIAGPSLALVRAEPEFVARAHARGNCVYVWTVDEPADVEFVLDLGVDAVITNRPGAVVERVGQRNS